MKVWLAARPVVVIALLPVAVLGLLISVTRGEGWMRYDPEYFTPVYLEKYATASATAKALEQGLQTGDPGLSTELQGLRRPRELPAGPDIELVMLWSRTTRYTTYLYVDRWTYQRYLYPLTQVRGRWVVAPEDIYYWMRSGRWRSLFLPVALTWWGLGFGMLGLRWLCHRSARVRGWLCGG